MFDDSWPHEVVNQATEPPSSSSSTSRVGKEVVAKADRYSGDLL